MDETSREVGIALRCTNNLIKREMGRRHPMSLQNRSTAMQGWVIGYVSQHEGEDVFQRDLETEFHVRRSTATAMLQLMEKNGLLERCAVPYDGRLKKLVLTQKAVQMHQHVMSEIREVETKMTQGISEEELQNLLKTLEKIRRNLE